MLITLSLQLWKSQQISQRLRIFNFSDSEGLSLWQILDPFKSKDTHGSLSTPVEGKFYSGSREEQIGQEYAPSQLLGDSSIKYEHLQISRSDIYPRRISRQSLIFGRWTNSSHLILPCHWKQIQKMRSRLCYTAYTGAHCSDNTFGRSFRLWKGLDTRGWEELKQSVGMRDLP